MDLYAGIDRFAEQPALHCEGNGVHLFGVFAALSGRIDFNDPELYFGTVFEFITPYMNQ